MSDYLLDILQDLLSNIDVNSIDIDNIDFENFFNQLSLDGIDLTQYSTEEIKDALDYALNNTNPYAFSDYADYFQSFLENNDVTAQNIRGLIDGINDYSNNGVSMPETDKTDVITKGIQEISSSFYNQPNIKSSVNPLEYKIGSNLGNHIKSSNISFKGIDKLLELVNYNTQRLTENLASSAPKELVHSLASDNQIKILFDKFIRVLGIS